MPVAAWSCWAVTSAVRVLDIEFMVWTWLSVAVCCMKAEVSTGLLGSWYWSWATSSCRNAFGSSALRSDPAELAAGWLVAACWAAAANAVGLTDETGVVIGFLASGSQPAVDAAVGGISDRCERTPQRGVGWLVVRLGRVLRARRRVVLVLLAAAVPDGDV